MPGYPCCATRLPLALMVLATSCASAPLRPEVRVVPVLLPAAEGQRVAQALEAYVLDPPKGWTLGHWQQSLPRVLGALAAHDPERALALVEKLEVLKAPALAEQRGAVIAALAHVLPASRRNRWLAEASGQDEPVVRAMILLDQDAPQVEEAVRLVNEARADAEGSRLAALFLALKVKAQGRPGWEQLRDLVPKGSSDMEHAFALLERLLGGPAELRALFDERTPDDSFLRGSLLDMTFVQIGPPAASFYATRLLEAAQDAPAPTSFLLASFALPHLPPRQQAQASALAAKTWDPKVLPKLFGLEHEAAYNALRALRGNQPELARAIFQALVDSILSFEDMEARSHFHAIGTAVGAIASIDPKLALATATRINSLEWSVHALRCAYRAWARVHPAEALAAKKVAPEGFEDVRTVQDLQLEAAVGAGLTDAAAALAALETLPDHPDRFEQGTSLVAPALAVKDPARAVGLLVRPGKPVPIYTALALSWMLAGEQVEAVFGTGAEDFADWLFPQGDWPGPSLSLSLRFGDVLDDVPLPPDDAPESEPESTPKPDSSPKE